MNKKILKHLKQLEVLIIEDDYFLGHTIVDALSPYCNQVMLAEDGEQGLSYYYKNSFNIIITDINLPKKSGLALAHEIRLSNKDIVIIILTAHDTDHNINTAIDLAAFAFLHKPFQLEQLYNTLLMSISKINTEPNFFTLGKNYRYNLKTKEVFHFDTKIHLTRTESLLLHVLITNAGQVVTFETLERNAWYDKQATPDTIRMYVNKLRSKLYYELIENIQGYGYKLVPQV